MSGATYYLETFGCQMNVLDSQLVEGQLRARGMRPTDSHHDADVILFNTCSVRQHAEDKVISRLGALRKFKQDRPETIIGVIGCMAEREKEGLFAKAPHVDLLCGPGELNQLPALLDEVMQRNERVAALAGSLSRRTEVMQRALEYDSVEALDLSRSPEPDENVLQSYIRVQRGCDKFCTYCVVPFTRGPERSRPPEHIVSEARMLAERGCREVTLLGQTVNSYVHQEDGHAVRFARLLERLHAVEGIERIRFVTSFPADWDEDIFRVMRDYPKIAPYLHIPAQSGSDRILKAMRRGYTASQYLKLMDTARKYVPQISLAGDFIVGFCGETERDFQASVDLVRRIEYKHIFVFKYSPRPGTAADRNTADDVPREVKARRNNELLAVQTEISQGQKQAFIGRSLDVLVEGYSKKALKARAAAERMSGNGSAHGKISGKTNGDFDGATNGKTNGDFNGTINGRADAGIDDKTGGHCALAPLQAGEQDRGVEVSREKSDQLVGRTPSDLITVFDGDPRYIGAIVRVSVHDATALTLFGKIERVILPAPQPARHTTRQTTTANTGTVGNAISLPVVAAMLPP